MFLGPGGSLVLANTVLRHNSAMQFGGGGALGTGFLAQGSCGFTGADVRMDNNAATHGGSQLYVACSGGEHATDLPVW